MMTLVVYISIIYYMIANSAYLFLLITSVWFLNRQNRVKPLLDALTEAFPAFAPPVSILAPAFNEQETIVQSIQSFLMLQYPSFEVVVINDGSSDETMQRLIAAFHLEPTDLPLSGSLSQTTVYGMYRSILHPNLVVVDKANGGKADALNIGIEVAQNDIFCAVDSDSILETDALLRVVVPFLENPDETIAAGGTVRIANGAKIRFGRVESVELSTNWVVLMQVIEYTRAFLCGRIGWNVLNSTLVISGAFGLFSKPAVLEAGGYTAGSIGEDMELILRLHKHFRNKKKPYRIVFVPDPVCWTEAPESIGSLQKQRNRWQRGLADSLIRNRSMIFNPRFGALGLLALPYFVFVELLGPVIEVSSLIFVGWSAYHGGIDTNLLFLFFIASILYGSILSVAAILIEEVYFAKYQRLRHFVTLLGVCMIESFGYRQMSSMWRILGLVKYVRGDNSWGHLKRVGFNTKP